ncbi:MAG: hypothetical protein IPK39_17905, partial [Sulfuritalea sp.]|nr:hypothetical protein [Sulfuritalea sp.]
MSVDVYFPPGTVVLNPLGGDGIFAERGHWQAVRLEVAHRFQCQIFTGTLAT